MIMCSYVHIHLAMIILYRIRSMDNDNNIAIYGILPYHKADNDNIVATVFIIIVHTMIMYYHSYLSNYI